LVVHLTVLSVERCKNSDGWMIVTSELGTRQTEMCIWYHQRDATYTMLFIIIISPLHVSGGFSTRHQDLIKLYVQPWVLSFFPAVYRLCAWVRTQTHPCRK